MRTALVLLCGGKGERFGSPVPKQFLSVKGKPLFLWALERLLQLQEIKEVVIPASPGYEEEVGRIVETLQDRASCTVIPGGKQRQDSVWQGLNALGDPELVLIHDAVRPFVPLEAVRQAMRVAYEKGAAILALAATDTVKKVTDGVIRATLPRQEVWLAQTPQVFRRELIYRAYERVIKEGIEITDDAQAVELLGEPVWVVEGTLSNQKITHPDDLEQHGFAEHVDPSV